MGCAACPRGAVRLQTGGGQIICAILVKICGQHSLWQPVDAVQRLARCILTQLGQGNARPKAGVDPLRILGQRQRAGAGHVFQTG